MRLCMQAIVSLLALLALLPAGSRVLLAQQRLLPVSVRLAADDSCLFGRCAAARLLPHLLQYAEVAPPAAAAAAGEGSRVKREALTESPAAAAAAATEEVAAADEEAARDAALSSEVVSIKRIQQSVSCKP